MKKYLYGFLLLAPYPCLAQLGVQSTGINIMSGTQFGIDSMVLTPSANLTIASNTITKTNVPVTSSGGGASIRRVHTFATPISYSGVLGVYYSAAQLNGNTEANLQIVHSNLSTGGTYVTTTGSTRGSTGSYYVSNTVSSITFGQLTSTNTGVSLPLKLLSFGAHTAGNCTNVVTWTVAEATEGVFAVETATDGRNWTGVPDQIRVSGYNYELTAASTGAAIAYYRLRMTEASGEVSYSNTQMVINSCDAGMEITLAPNPVRDQCRIRSAGVQAMLVRVYDVAGRQVLTTKTEANGEALLDVSSFPAGIYVVTCIFDTHVAMARFTKE